MSEERFQYPAQTTAIFSGNFSQSGERSTDKGDQDYPDHQDRVSFAPLSFEEAVGGLLATPPGEAS